MLIICEEHCCKAALPSPGKGRKYLLDTRYLTVFNSFSYFLWKWKPLLVVVGLNKRLEFHHFPLCFPQSLAAHRVLLGWERQHFLAKQFDLLPLRHGPGYTPCGGVLMHPGLDSKARSLWEKVCVCVWCVWEPRLVLSSPAHSCHLVLAYFRCCSWAYAPLSWVKPRLIYKVLVFNRLYKKYTKTLLIPAPSSFPPLFVGNNLQYNIFPWCFFHGLFIPHLYLMLLRGLQEQSQHLLCHNSVVSFTIW